MRVPSDANPDIQQAFRDIHAALRQLGRESLNVDYKGKRIINAGAAVSGSDYVTLEQLRRALNDATSQAAQQAVADAATSGTPTVVDDGKGSLGCSECGSDGHPTVTVKDVETAGKIVCGVAQEFPGLLAATADQPTRDANRDQLLDRMVWHLNLLGFPASRYGTVAGRPWILLFNTPDGTEYAYRVSSYETFETPFTAVMVFGGASPGTTVVVDAGIAD